MFSSSSSPTADNLGIYKPTKRIPKYRNLRTTTNSTIQSKFNSSSLPFSYAIGLIEPIKEGGLSTISVTQHERQSKLETGFVKQPKIRVRAKSVPQQQRSTMTIISPAATPPKMTEKEKTKLTERIAKTLRLANPKNWNFMKQKKPKENVKTILPSSPPSRRLITPTAEDLVDAGFQKIDLDSSWFLFFLKGAELSKFVECKICERISRDARTPCCKTSDSSTPNQTAEERSAKAGGGGRRAKKPFQFIGSKGRKNRIVRRKPTVLDRQSPSTEGQSSSFHNKTPESAETIAVVDSLLSSINNDELMELSSNYPTTLVDVCESSISSLRRESGRKRRTSSYRSPSPIPSSIRRRRRRSSNEQPPHIHHTNNNQATSSQQSSFPSSLIRRRQQQEEDIRPLVTSSTQQNVPPVITLDSSSLIQQQEDFRPFVTSSTQQNVPPIITLDSSSASSSGLVVEQLLTSNMSSSLFASRISRRIDDFQPLLTSTPISRVASSSRRQQQQSQEEIAPNYTATTQTSPPENDTIFRTSTTTTTFHTPTTTRRRKFRLSSQHGTNLPLMQKSEGGSHHNSPNSPVSPQQNMRSSYDYIYEMNRRQKSRDDRNDESLFSPSSGHRQRNSSSGPLSSSQETRTEVLKWQLEELYNQEDVATYVADVEKIKSGRDYEKFTKTRNQLKYLLEQHRYRTNVLCQNDSDADDDLKAVINARKLREEERRFYSLQYEVLRNTINYRHQQSKMLAKKGQGFWDGLVKPLLEDLISAAKENAARSSRHCSHDEAPFELFNKVMRSCATRTQLTELAIDEIGRLNRNLTRQITKKLTGYEDRSADHNALLQLGRLRFHVLQQGQAKTHQVREPKTGRLVEEPLFWPIQEIFGTRIFLPWLVNEGRICSRNRCQSTTIAEQERRRRRSSPPPPKTDLLEEVMNKISNDRKLEKELNLKWNATRAGTEMASAFSFGGATVVEEDHISEEQQQKQQPIDKEEVEEQQQEKQEKQQLLLSTTVEDHPMSELIADEVEEIHGDDAIDDFLAGDRADLAIAIAATYIRPCSENCQSSVKFDELKKQALVVKNELLKVLQRKSYDLATLKGYCNLLTVKRPELDDKEVYNWLVNYSCCWQGLRSIVRRLDEMLYLCTFIDRSEELDRQPSWDKMEKVLSMDYLPSRLILAFEHRCANMGGRAADSEHQQAKVYQKFG